MRSPRRSENEVGLGSAKSSAPQLAICSRRAERLLGRLYLLGTTVVASWLGAADDLAPFPGPAENSADIVKRTSIMMAKPPNAMTTHVSRKPVAAANGLSEERTS